jgi:hypothetical protein
MLKDGLFGPRGKRPASPDYSTPIYHIFKIRGEKVRMRVMPFIILFTLTFILSLQGRGD